MNDRYCEERCDSQHGCHPYLNYSFCDFKRQTGTVLKATAVLISSRVRSAPQELVRR